MPNRNTVKQYVEGGYYHLYNRGVEKRPIFLDDQDYRVFLSYLELYLSPLVNPTNPLSKPHKDIYGFNSLISYCLMPTHFHLAVKQSCINGITELMRCVMTQYVMYFNFKYGRVGGLFEGRYKAILVQSDVYLSHLSAYIHLNPTDLGSDPAKYPYSSYQYYLKGDEPAWLDTEHLLNMFAGRTNYKDFVSTTALWKAPK